MSDSSRTVEPGRSGKTFVTLRDDVHNFIGACRKEFDAGKDLYDVVKMYGAKRQARRAVSRGDFFPALRGVLSDVTAYASDCALGRRPNC